MHAAPPSGLRMWLSAPALPFFETTTLGLSPQIVPHDGTRRKLGQTAFTSALQSELEAGGPRAKWKIGNTKDKSSNMSRALRVGWNRATSRGRFLRVRCLRFPNLLDHFHL